MAMERVLHLTPQQAKRILEAQKIEANGVVENVPPDLSDGYVTVSQFEKALGEAIKEGMRRGLL